MFISEVKAPQPISKLVTPYSMGDDLPVAFTQKIYYHSISPQLQVGVAGYSKLLDLSNIMINSDNEQAKKVIEEWIDNTDFKTKLEAMGNTLLICGNSIIEKLSDTQTVDIAEVDMNTIVDKQRDEFGKTLYYIQQTPMGQMRLGETTLKRFIEFNLTSISRSKWSPCIFESAAIPRKVGNRTTLPLVELVVGLEDAMSTIVLNNAYPEVFYTYEGANPEELQLEAEKIRKKKPGDKNIGTRKPLVDIIEAKGQSAFVDYINYLYKSLGLAVKFPIDILTGDFTSRASSDTTEDLTIKLAKGFQRYIASKLKNELFDPILTQSGIDPKNSNLEVTFGTQEIIKFTPEIVGQRYKDGLWSLEEGREWDKDNAGVDLFDDDIMNNDKAQADAQQQTDLELQKISVASQLKAQPKDAMSNLKKEMDEKLLKRDEQIELLKSKIAERDIKESGEKAKTTKEILDILRELK